MKVGVIGAGNWGKNLVRTFHQLHVLGGVAEVSSGLRQAVVEEYPGIPVYEVASDIFASDISAVVIATPVSTHYTLAREALMVGMDVFVEKPLTLSIEEAQELVVLANKMDCILMVGHLLLYQPAIRWMKDYIQSGGIGQVVSLSQERLKLGRVRQVENVLWSLGVHDIAVLLYLVGEAPIRVKATGQCFLQPNIEDDVYVHLGFSNGIMAHLHTSWLWPEQRRHLVVVGSEGMLIYDELQQRVTLYRKRIDMDLQNLDQGSEVVFEGDAEPLLLECQHFLECVSYHKQPISHGASAVEVVGVLEKSQKQLKGDET